MDLIVTLLLPLAIAIIMLSLGTGLTLNDFRRIGQRPRVFLIGALCQVVLLPALAYGVIVMFGFANETAVGIMILAACPGGVTSNIVTKLVGWDVALSVTLTAARSLTCVITAPLLLDVAMRGFVAADTPSVDISRTALVVFMLSTVPIMAGVAFRALAPHTASRSEPGLARIAVLLFCAVIVAAILSNLNVIADDLLRLGPALLFLIVTLSAVSFLVSRRFGATAIQARTITIEAGLQNGSLGIGIAALVVSAGDGFSPYAVPSAVYSVIYLLTVLPVLFLVRALR